MGKKVLIIGGGLAGLTSAITLLSRGYTVHLFEKNNEVGGLCSGYEVKGRYIDACIHWLTGTKKDNKFNNLLRMIDALNDDVKIYSLPTLGTFIYEGTKVAFYRDLDKGLEEWLKISPEDKDNIELFFETVKSFCSLEDVMDQKDDKPFYLSDKIKKILKIAPKSKEIYQSMKLSREEYASRFKSEAIRYAITNGQNGFNSMFFFFMEYAMFVNGNADIPEGGAGPLIQRVKDKFLSLGGILHTNSEVTNIIKHKKQIMGVKVGDEIYLGDVVLSCLDPHYTYKRLLGGQIYNKRLRNLEKNESEHKLSSSYNLYLLIKDEMKDIDIPTGIRFEPMKIGKNEYSSMFFRPYTYDDCYIKNGEVVTSILIDQTLEDYKYFSSLCEEDYRNKIDEINHKLVEAVITQFPNLKGKIKILDFFGPKEMYQRTYSRGGAILSYSLNLTNLLVSIKFVEKGYKNLFLASQWNSPIGGTPNAVNNGYMAAIEIDKYLKKK